MSDDGRFNNYHLGVLIVAAGLMFFGCDGPLYSERRRTVSADPALIGLLVVAIGVWTLVKEFRRRRRDH